MWKMLSKNIKFWPKFLINNMVSDFTTLNTVLRFKVHPKQDTYLIDSDSEGGITSEKKMKKLGPNRNVIENKQHFAFLLNNCKVAKLSISIFNQHSKGQSLQNNFILKIISIKTVNSVFCIEIILRIILFGIESTAPKSNKKEKFSFSGTGY